jgi:hypothetical protein
MTDAELVALFRTIAPEFALVTDEQILTNINIYKDFVSERVFGKVYYKALCYFTAHMMTVEKIIAEEGASSSYITAGGITSEKEGDLQRSYANTSSNSSIDDLLNKTFYGKMFLQLRGMCKIPAITRFAPCQ